MKRTVLQFLGQVGRHRPARPGPPRNVNSVLFLQYQTALGSAIHGTPVFEAIKRQANGIRIGVACSGVTHETLGHNPCIDEVFVTRHPLKNFLGALLDFHKLRRRLRDFDVIVTDASNSRTKIVLLGLVPGGGERVGFTLAPELYSRVLQYRTEISLIENNLRILPALGLKQVHVEPRIGFSASDLIEARELLGLGERADRRPIVALVTQTSGGHRKAWRGERFAELADSLVASSSCRIVFVGTAGEVAGVERIRERMKSGSVSLAGRTNLTQLAALLSICDLTVTLDTGPLHVARAVGLPGVVIAPGWLPPVEWLPLDNDRFAILIGADPRVGDASAEPPQYIDDVEVAKVIEAAHQMLQKFPPSELAREWRVDRNMRRDVTVDAFTRCGSAQPSTTTGAQPVGRTTA
jgi:ADP-heptose:LPS heptosyltransferase